MKKTVMTLVTVLIIIVGIFLILPTEEKNMDFKWLQKVTGGLPKIEERERNIKMIFFGDLMLDRSVRDKIDKSGNDILNNLTENNFLQGYNLVAANLEGTVTVTGEHYAPINKYDFAFRPENVLEIIRSGFNFFTLANNHFNDQGSQGQLETRKFLDENKTNYVGCYADEVDEYSYRILDVNGKKIGMFGFSLLAGRINSPDFTEKMFVVIKKVRPEVDLVVVNLHWGNEYEIQFNASQQKMAHDLIDVGVDIIIGHHPHVVQGVEIYKNKPIFYSLGNFVFDQYFSEETQRGLAIGFDWVKDDLNIEIHPFKSVLSRVFILQNEEKIDFLGRLKERSYGSSEFLQKVEDGHFNMQLRINSQ